MITLPETNMAPSKWWLEDYFPIGKVTFQGLLYVSFRECIYLVVSTQKKNSQHGSDLHTYNEHLASFNVYLNLKDHHLVHNFGFIGIVINESKHDEVTPPARPTSDCP